MRLADVLELPSSPANAGEVFTEIVVLGAAEKRVAFAVEAVLAEQEVLVKPLGKPLLRVRNVAGATVLGSGKPAVILNTSDLLKSAGRARAVPAPIVAAKPAAFDSPLQQLNPILDGAVDGQDAFTTLREREFDLLISDVEMPRVDGFELTAKVRADPKLAELPVILVTALGSREHQERGVDAGANAYIIKSSFDQTSLLEVVKRLV